MVFSLDEKRRCTTIAEQKVPHTSPSTTKPVKSAEMKTARILIVEDEAPHATDLKVRVETLGHHVLGVVDNGEKALHFVQRYRPDLVLMDVGIRGTADGVEAARTIWETTKTPFVYITAYSEASIMNRTDGVEPYGFVGKPFHDRELQAAIEIALYKAAVESAVRKNERMLETMVRSLRDGALAIDQHEHILFMNPIAELLTGWRSADAIGKDIRSVLETMVEDERQELNMCIRIVLRQGGGLSVSNITLKSRRGASIVVDATITGLTTEQGEKEGAVVLLHDASQRLRAERDIRFHQSFFRQLFDHSPDAIAILDPSDYVVDVNPAFTRLFGYCVTEAQGKSINDLVVPTHLLDEAHQLSRQAQTQDLAKTESVRRRKDGTLIPVSILAVPIMIMEDSFGVFVIYRDLTGQMHRQRE